MAKITENDIELYAIEELENLGYSYIYGPDIAPDTDAQERTSFDQVILTERFQKAIDRINPTIPNNAKEDALKKVLRIGTPDLLTDNETFHKMLTEGINVTYQKDGSQRGDIVKLVDFDTVNNNEFNVINQFTVIENNNNKRPDVILFINGLPLVVVGLKNSVDENATIRSAYKQIQTYKATIPSLFIYNSILVISDGTEAKTGSLSAGFTRFMSWKTADGESEASHLIPEMETLINGMLNKETVLDLIRHFIVFEKYYNSGEYQKIFNLFSPEMKDALPKDKNKEYLTGLKHQAGKIKSRKFIRYVKGTFASYKTTFDDEITMLYISTDSESKINGFYIEPFEELPKLERNSTKLILPFKNEWTVTWGGDIAELNYHVESRAQKNAFDLVVSDDNGKCL